MTSPTATSPSTAITAAEAAKVVKAPAKLLRQMAQRGWTDAQIVEALASSEHHPVLNLETGGTATRYIHPTTGRSVVIDDASGEVIHVGGDGFIY